MESHEDFHELCALATSGDLSHEEQERLDVHLAGCAECREALGEFEAAATIGVPLLLSEMPEIHADRNARVPVYATWNLVWASFVAVVLLMCALGIYTYRMGRSRSSEAAQATVRSDDANVKALEQQLSDAGHERGILEAQLADRDHTISSIRRQIEIQSSALSQMKAVQANLQQTVTAADATKQQTAEANDKLGQELSAAQASLDKMQVELGTLQEERNEGEARLAALKAQDGELSGQLRQQNETISRQDELLAHDRDIRELMGARDLYIAEVYDVGQDAKTAKPYGRMFYTKGKSLVFYAYDLDRQPGLQNASTFQAWGRLGQDYHHALSLGIFYEDSAAKKRWVLKSDNPKDLSAIDAVFVTVEPHGGSHEPSGKPLLFAYLKIDPNHP
jgi:peptidoglycan hydrolase CwlO-like protein